MSPKAGAFDLRDPLPELDHPTLLFCLRPWIDVGSVGTMALAYLEEAWSAQPLGQLSRPGVFYDFTRYRPGLSRRGGQRTVSVPNTTLHVARGEGRDWVLAHALEPHANGEDYADSLLEVLTTLGAGAYCMIGSMYAPVPHTRPPLATGGATGEAIRQRLLKAGVRESNYEGPTTILATIPARALEVGIETASVILQLPAYAQIERDYRGLQAMLELLGRMFEVSLDTGPVRQEADRQQAALNETAAEDVQLRDWVAELETVYDSEQHPQEQPPAEPTEPLSPELERFIRDVESRLDEKGTGS